jgi:hypothetical protein
VALTTHPNLVPRLKKEYSYTSTPPLRLHGLLQGDLYLYLFTYALHHEGLQLQELLTFTQDECSAFELQNVPLKGHPITGHEGPEGE